MTYIDKMITYYGDPVKDHVTFEHKWMVLYELPGSITGQIKNIPAKIYCNKELLIPLQDTLLELIKKNLHQEIKIFNGCFCIRCQRNSTILSVHSFAMGIDLNDHDNPFGHTTQQDIQAGLKPFSEAFVQCWRDMGWICGRDFQRGRNDDMHFEWTKKFMQGI